MSRPFRRHLRSRAMFALAGLATVVLASCAPTGKPITAIPAEPGPPPVTASPATLTAVNSAMWQTDQPVWALAASGGKLYAGGDFTKVRPPGTSTGDAHEKPASKVTAFNTSDGTPVSYTVGPTTSIFNHNIDGHVGAVAVSPDGHTLYVGGGFNKVDGATHPRVAAFDLTNITAGKGPALLAWNPNVTASSVRAITVSADSSKVFIGGDFTGVGGTTAQPRLAELNASNGSAVNWHPVVDGPVDALLVAPNTNDLIVGGDFETVNSVALRALASINMTDGTNGPLDPLIRTCGPGCANRSDIKTLVTDGTNVYAGAEGTGAGWFDGTLAFDPTTGHQVWFDNCLGATQGIAIVGEVLYVGSHAHDCTAIGAFGQLPITTGPGSGSNMGPASWHHLLGEQISDGKMLDWFPTTNPGALNPQGGLPPNTLGPRALATDGTNLFVGGQFTTVNGAPQQGLTRFMNGAPRAAPSAVTSGFGSLLPGGGAVFDFVGTSDKDSGALTYKVYRDGNLSAPIKSIGPYYAHWWNAGLFQARESGLTAGSHYYQVAAIDEGGLTTLSGKFTVSATGPGYQQSVLANSPNTYWRVAETSGTLAADTSGRGNAGTYSGGLNRGIPGAVPGNFGMHIGADGNVFSNASAMPAPTTYSVGVWIRTTTTRGGMIMSFGDSQAGTSRAGDRRLYMLNSGQLIFGTYKGAVNYLWTPKSYNDGNRHFILFEQDPGAGMRLYVDGTQIAYNNNFTTAASFNGWWRLGADDLSGWPVRPSNAGLITDIDEVAIYGQPLTSAVMKSQMTAQ